MREKISVADWHKNNALSREAAWKLHSVAVLTDPWKEALYTASDVSKLKYK